MNISLKLEERTLEGKKLAILRQQGLVPSVVYGGSDEPTKMQSNQIDTIKAVRAVGKHTPLHLNIGNKKRLAIIKDIDLDPVKHNIRHIAFHTIKQNDIITTEVPIILVGVGESPAERAGLVVLQAIEQLEIKAKPADLPESIEISIMELSNSDDKILVSSIKLPIGVEYADKDQDMELVIANVYEPGALQAANESAGGSAEPEDEDSVPADEGSEKTVDKAEEKSE